jgi:glycosyltransferase involved in cell wall biosynthesis
MILNNQSNQCKCFSKASAKFFACGSIRAAKEFTRMEIRPEHITIAVTVFNRREYVFEAIHSALSQTIPVKVIVVEDCGPDATLRDFIVAEFGSRIEYFRNPTNRGLFDNWNACMDYCRTPWFSILHDDDWLYPHFIETMLAVAQQAPGRKLYYGRRDRLLPDGNFYPPPPPSWNQWRDLDSGQGLMEMLDESILGFPGQLIHIASAKTIGGFRKNSFFTGDWDMWFRMALRFGAVESAIAVAVGRCHEDFDRASSHITRKGWKWLLDNVQRKRNLAMLAREKGMVLPFERAKPVKQDPFPLRLLLRFAHGFSSRLLFYNWWLFTQSKPPHWRYAMLQWFIRILGPRSLRVYSKASKIYAAKCGAFLL